MLTEYIWSISKVKIVATNSLVCRLYISLLLTGAFFPHSFVSVHFVITVEGNQSNCLMQPSNHLLTVISSAFLKRKHNSLANSALCINSPREASFFMSYVASVTRESRVQVSITGWINDSNTCGLHAPGCSPLVLQPRYSMNKPDTSGQSHSAVFL